MELRSIYTCIPHGHLHTVTYTRCIDTIEYPDDEHMAVRNMKNIEINIYGKELCDKSVVYNNYLYIPFRHVFFLVCICHCPWH